MAIEGIEKKEERKIVFICRPSWCESVPNDDYANGIIKAIREARDAERPKILTAILPPGHWVMEAKITDDFALGNEAMDFSALTPENRSKVVNLMKIMSEAQRHGAKIELTVSV